VLDEQKKIIAKRLKTDQLIPFMEGYVDRKKSEGKDTSRIAPKNTTN
jgi:hypothetical protein